MKRLKSRQGKTDEKWTVNRKTFGKVRINLPIYKIVCRNWGSNGNCGSNLEREDKFFPIFNCQGFQLAQAA